MRRPRDLSSYPIDPAAAGPPTDVVDGHSGNRTFRPVLMEHDAALDELRRIAERHPTLGRFFRRRVEQSNYIRTVIERDYREIERILGGENIALSYLTREGFSTDSTGHRGFVTEAVMSPPTVEALQAILGWCYRNRIPAIPYGAGGGYNMGVVPKAPAVTIWPAAMRTIGAVSRETIAGTRDRYSVEVEAGVPYDTLVDELSKQGFAVRCVPNTPRASVGGVVATGSNGGKRIAEIIIDGKAVLADGRLVRFATTAEERRFLEENPFPLIHKFHGAPNTAEALRALLAADATLPASLFVASEGTTGIITSVRLSIEKRPRFSLSIALWLDTLDDVPGLARRINALPHDEKPVYFELLTEPAISHYLASDYPDLFRDGQAAYMVLSFEADHCDALEEIRTHVSDLVRNRARVRWVGPYAADNPPAAATRLAAPREALPGKLKTKCKADIEVLLSHLPEAIHLLSADTTASGEVIESILFGHLSLQQSAIVHWNIGGVDLSVEQTAAEAWDHLEGTIAELIEPDPSGVRRACFTGEHGAGGKPALFRRSLSRDELARIYRIKRVLDPRRILNPATLYLPTRISRALHGRALAAKNGERHVETRIAELAGACTRCNACQSCIVLDAQADLRTKRPKRNRGGWISGKRHLLQLLELLHTSTINDDQRQELLEECRESLEMCMSCGRCDDLCPVDISMAELRELVSTWSGTPHAARPLAAFLHRFMLAPAQRGLPFLLSRSALCVANRFPRLWQGARFSSRALAGYLALPPLGWRKYQPEQIISTVNLSEELAAIGAVENSPRSDTVFIRFRGCVGTVGHVEGTRNEDRFIVDVGGLPFLDFRPDLCCGYPHQSAGSFKEAKQRRLELVRRLGSAAREAQQRLGAQESVVFSSCPTCQESLRLGLTETSPSEADFTVVDPAELPMHREDTARVMSGEPPRRIGLKVPCHATSIATDRQRALLERFGFEVVRLDKCCGMAGTGRLKHPEIGLALAESLSKTIRSHALDTIVSGCPSCRDGVTMQALLEGRSSQTFDMFGMLLTTV